MHGSSSTLRLRSLTSECIHTVTTSAVDAVLCLVLEHDEFLSLETKRSLSLHAPLNEPFSPRECRPVKEYGVIAQSSRVHTASACAPKTSVVESAAENKIPV
jgi:hypothetical protein